MKALAALAVAATIAIAAVLALRTSDPATARASHTAVAPERSELSARSVLRINPRAASSNVDRAPAATPPAAVPPEVAQLRTRTGWAGLARQITGAPQTGATLYVQAEIYNRCAKRPTPPGTPLTAAQRRERFLATIEGQPDHEARLAAYDKNNVNSCEGIAQEDFSDDKLAAMIAAAAAAGDARAQAWQVARAVQGELAQRTPGDPPRGLAISDDQVETIRRTLASRDPGVVREYQGVLASTAADGTWRIPGVEGRIDERAMWAALSLVACDLGDRCGPDASYLLSACATNGYCAATNMYDHMYFYESAPNQAQLMERYRQALVQAINSGDLSGLRIVREPTNQNRQYMFTGRRGP